MNLYYHGISNVNVFLAKVRMTGLAGSIVQDSPQNRRAGDIASWSGDHYQIALVGDRETCELEIREMQNGEFTTLRRSSDIAQFDSELLFFVVQEG